MQSEVRLFRLHKFVRQDEVGWRKALVMRQNCALGPETKIEAMCGFKKGVIQGTTCGEGLT